MQKRLSQSPKRILSPLDKWLRNLRNFKFVEGLILYACVNTALAHLRLIGPQKRHVTTVARPLEREEARLGDIGVEVVLEAKNVPTRTFMYCIFLLYYLFIIPKTRERVIK